MRHRVKGKKFNRNASHRKAMFRNIVLGLLQKCSSDSGGLSSCRIVTTIAKAKAARAYVDRLITLAKKAAVVMATVRAAPVRSSPEWQSWRKSADWVCWAGEVAPAVCLRRRAFAVLRSDVAVKVLFQQVAPRFAARSGGYTRVVRLPSHRVGDATRLAILELSDASPRI